MKRQIWAPVLAVAMAVLILVPTTFAVGEPGTTQYAQLGFNRFFNRIAAVDAQLHFLTDGSARLDIQIVGGAGRAFAIRVYADGTCADPGRWIINRAPGAGLAGPFITLQGNTNAQIPVHPLDLQRLREELAGNPNEIFALAVAVVNPTTNSSYRTCTNFGGTPLPPITTSTTTSATTSPGTTTAPTSTTTTAPATTSTSSLTFPTTTTQTSTITSLTTGTQFSTGTTVTTGVTTTFGTTPVSTSTVLQTTTLQTVVTIPGVTTATTATGTATQTVVTTVYSTFTTGTAPATRTTTFTTATGTFTTGTTFTVTSTFGI